MKNTIAISAGAFILVIAFNRCFPNLYAQSSPKSELAETKQTTAGTFRKTEESRPKMNFVKMADFYLRNEELVFGKLVSESKNKIIVEELDESRIIVSTYSKRQIDSRTLRTRSIPEYKYYLELAEYFSARTWDFTDDPDDFIQAIRCYEKAKQLVEQPQTQDSEKVEQINQMIKKLQADRQVWIRETTSRAKLKKLEFEATIETRMNELEDKVNASVQKIDETVERFDKIIVDTKENNQKLKEVILEIDKDISRQLDILENRVYRNRRLIDDINYSWRRYPVYPRLYRRDSKPDK